jgi:hypothetical protein
MQFLKKHYEKIILSAVLLGLAAAAFWLSVAVDDAKKQLVTTTITEPPSPKPWVALDLAKYRGMLAALHNPPSLDLSGAHNLFNPVTWKRMRDGKLVKVLLEGPAALTVTDIRPLYYYIYYDSKVADGFYLYVQPPPPARQETKKYYKLDEKDKSKPCVIVGTNDAPDGTSTLQLQIIATGETVSVTTKKPYRRVADYEADMKYPPDNIAPAKKRVGDDLKLSDEPYKIIAITNNALTIQDTRTLQRTKIDWIGAH